MAGTEVRAGTKTVVAVAVAAVLAVVILVALSSRYEVVTTSRSWTLSRTDPFRLIEVDEP